MMWFRRGKKNEQDLQRLLEEMEEKHRKSQQRMDWHTSYPELFGLAHRIAGELRDEQGTLTSEGVEGYCVEFFDGTKVRYRQCGFFQPCVLTVVVRGETFRSKFLDEILVDDLKEWHRRRREKIAKEALTSDREIAEEEEEIDGE